MSTIYDVLSETLPEVVANLDKYVALDCWIGRVLQRPHLHHEFENISAALDIVVASTSAEVLKTKIRREHPAMREHKEQHDIRVLDCFTEAIGFAWAQKHYGSAELRDNQGEPDVFVSPATWVEVKTIHHSDADRAQIKWMRKTGEAVMVQAEAFQPRPLLMKFESALADATKKFQRVGSLHGAVFFHLSGLDLGALIQDDVVFQSLRRWLQHKERQPTNMRFALAYNYKWEELVWETGR